jgi:putative ABC transport system permease protein
MEILKYALFNLMLKPLRTTILCLTTFICSFLLILTFAIPDTSTKYIKEDIITKMSGHILIRKSDKYEFNYENVDFDKKAAEYLKTYLKNNKDINSYYHFIKGNFEIQVNFKRDFIDFTACDFQNDTRLLKRLQLIEGSFPKNNEKFCCIIDTETQKKLKVKIGDSITIFISSIYGAKDAMDFLITGIYYPSAPWYESTLMLSVQDYSELTDLSEINSYYKIYVKNEKSIPKIINDINSNITSFKALSYNSEEIYMAPFILNIGKSGFLLLFIITLIFFFVLMISMRSIIIVNIYDRRKEIGTLRAIGFNKNRVISIFFLEILITIIVGYIAALISSSLLTFFLDKSQIEMPILLFRFLTGMCTIKINISIFSAIFPFFLIVFLIFLMIIRTISKESNKQGIQQV